METRIYVAGLLGLINKFDVVGYFAELLLILWYDYFSVDPAYETNFTIA